MWMMKNALYRDCKLLINAAKKLTYKKNIHMPYFKVYSIKI